MSERAAFIGRLLDGERMADLCREYGISRKTGYKLLRRYEEHGPDGLYDQSRRPLSSPARTPAALQKQIIGARQLHPTWGAGKLRAWLVRRHPGLRWPARSTIHELLKREGLVQPRKRGRKAPPFAKPLAHADAPNRLWCADYKGQFKLGNGSYCYPLTVTDAYSRKLLACVALENTRTEHAMAVFAETFGEWGLPQAIRTDNGPPFATTALHGLSRLSVWWRRHGVEHERITPGQPQQNGSHERMHLTLKQCCTRPAGSNQLQQQERFDAFAEEFNRERPHESLSDDVPDDHYVRSSRIYSPHLEPLDYPLHDKVLKVAEDGRIRLTKRRGHSCSVYVSAVLGGEHVGARELADGRWQLDWMDVRVGIIERDTCRFEPAETGDVSP